MGYDSSVEHASEVDKDQQGYDSSIVQTYEVDVVYQGYGSSVDQVSVADKDMTFLLIIRLKIVAFKKGCECAPEHAPEGDNVQQGYDSSIVLTSEADVVYTRDMSVLLIRCLRLAKT